MAKVPIIVVYCWISLLYRIQTQLHTVEQIVVGTVVGSTNGALWWLLCTSTNGNFNTVEWIQASPIMDSQTGLLPWYWMSVPALVGAAVVGSVERRLIQFLKKKKNSNRKQDTDKMD